jgi:hypothetical protein
VFFGGGREFPVKNVGSGVVSEAGDGVETEERERV